MDLDTHQASLPRLPTHLSTQLRNILAHYSMLAGRELSTLIARQNMDGSELEFGNMLVEDKVSNEVDYPSVRLLSFPAYRLLFPG
jgi:protein transport protein SEC24